MTGTAILGTGSYAPERIVTNRELIASGLDTTDEWIVERTGIRERRIASPEEATSDLAARAAERALEMAGIKAADLDLIICATSTPDHPLPATANLIQHKLKCDAGALDVNAACSGFVYALSVGFALRSSGQARYVLVVGADTYSRILDWEDRRSAIFFGDGAGAAVLGPTSSGDWLLSSVHGSDGSGARQIMVQAGGSRLPATEERVRSRLTRFHMDGRAVWSFAVARMPATVREVATRAGLAVADIRLLIPHQSNQRMLEACCASLGLEEERLFLNVDRYANTASASVAIALDEAVRQRRIRPGDPVVLVGFGGGLSWSAVCLRWGNAGEERATPPADTRTPIPADGATSVP